MTDTDLLDFLADNLVIEGFGLLPDDIHDYAARIAGEEPNRDDYRRALRQMLADAMAKWPAPPSDPDHYVWDRDQKEYKLNDW